MNQYIASVDVGTTGARCALIDLNGKIVASEYCEYGAVYLKPGWVEQDADEMIAVAMQVCNATVAKSGIRPEQIAAIGFSTQRSVTVPVYKDGSKVRLALSWQDSRTGAEVADMAQADRRRGVLPDFRHADGHNLEYHQDALDAQERA